jgi:predicted nucleic acid-binding protein
VIVVDASVIVELLLQTPVGRDLADRLLGGDASLVAPHLLDLEVAHVLRRYCLRGEMRPARAAQAVALLAELPITRYGHTDLLPRIWELRHNVTAHDAAYLALAEALGARLLTRDARLAAARGRIKVELV